MCKHFFLLHNIILFFEYKNKYFKVPNCHFEINGNNFDKCCMNNKKNNSNEPS